RRVADCLLRCLRCRPRSSRFPYTTLFRSHDRRGDGRRRGEQCAHDGGGRTPARGGRPGGGMNPIPRSTYRIQLTAEFPLTSAARSEEHTSELQSRENLVCRLLLEKKNHQQ